MNYKTELQKLIDTLDSKGITRDKIEADLRYSENYIDKVLSKGGNSRVYTKVKTYLDEKQYAIPKDGLAEDRAVIQTLIVEVAKLKSKIYGTKFEDAVEELRQNSKLALHQ